MTMQRLPAMSSDLDAAPDLERAVRSLGERLGPLLGAVVDDRRRDLDRLEVVESVEAIGRGLGRAAGKPFPPYVDLMKHVFSMLDWDSETFLVHRVEIDDPVHGMQVAVAFEAPGG
jgi:hypothetical protein